MIALQFAIFQVLQLEAAYGRSAPYYDPEMQDGIPVMSARSLSPARRYQFDESEVPQASSGAMSSPRRRSADSDLDDGLEEEEDEDRDDYNRAGSSNHDSYENPAFGESRNAARDGDDIESFFDKHLGPPQDIAPSDDGGESSEVPINEVATKPAVLDSDDQYEAAASSPLSTIFHSILSAHKRPLVITTEEEPSDQADSGKTAGSGSSAQAATIKINLPPIVSAA